MEAKSIRRAKTWDTEVLHHEGHEGSENEALGRSLKLRDIELDHESSTLLFGISWPFSFRVLRALRGENPFCICPVQAGARDRPAWGAVRVTIFYNC